MAITSLDSIGLGENTQNLFWIKPEINEMRKFLKGLTTRLIECLEKNDHDIDQFYRKTKISRDFIKDSITDMAQKKIIPSISSGLLALMAIVFEEMHKHFLTRQEIVARSKFQNNPLGDLTNTPFELVMERLLDKNSDSYLLTDSLKAMKEVKPGENLCQVEKDKIIFFIYDIVSHYITYDKLILNTDINTLSVFTDFAVKRIGRYRYSCLEFLSYLIYYDKKIKPSVTEQILQFILYALEKELPQTSEIKREYPIFAKCLKKFNTLDPKADSDIDYTNEVRKIFGGEGTEIGINLYEALQKAGLKPVDCYSVIKIITEAPNKYPDEKKQNQLVKYFSSVNEDIGNILSEYFLTCIKWVRMKFDKGKRYVGLNMGDYYQGNNLQTPFLLWNGLCIATAASGFYLKEDEIISILKPFPPDSVAYILSIIKYYETLGTMNAVHSILNIRKNYKWRNVLKACDTAVERIAKKHDLSSSEIADICLPTFNLDQNHRFEFSTNEGTLILFINNIYKADIKFIGNDGKENKNVSTDFKTKYPEDEKEFKNAKKELDNELIIYKARLERHWIDRVVYSREKFCGFMLAHPIASKFASNLIWKDENNKTFCGRKEELPEDSTTISLWHPVDSETKEIKIWRERIIAEKINQPFKQVFREIYIKNNEELNNEDHISYRFMNQVLHRKIYNGLLISRLWTGGSALGYESEMQDPKLYLISKQLRACFKWHECESENLISVGNIWFEKNKNKNEWERVPIAEIPSVLFSETMRDIDLFVSVAGVKPNEIIDNTKAKHYFDMYMKNFWSGISELRSDLLIGVINSLNKENIKISERHVFVKGKLHTYRIHINSGNVYIDDQDQFVFIAPENLKVKFSSPTIDDDVKAIEIVKKILYLLNDDKITDESFVSQIR